MPFIDDFDDSALQDENRDPVLRRLDTLLADPIRQEFGDPALVDYIDRQRDRLTDANGAPVGGDFEPFEPAVQRSDIRLESPVGAEEANHPIAVYNAKKLLSAAGFHDFAPGIEGMGEASPHFLADLRRFQAAHDLAPDAVAQPGGPTVHMLTRKVFGLADGPPPDSETEHFQERFAKDPNRTLSGQPIFGGPDGAFIEASAADETAADAIGDNLAVRSDADAGDPQPFGDDEEGRPEFLQLSDARGAAIIGKEIRKAENAPTLAQLGLSNWALDNRNPFSPLRLSPGDAPRAREILKEMKNRDIGHLTHEQKVLALRYLWANTSRTPEQDAAARELLLAFPPSYAFIADRNRRASEFAKILWGNADVKSATLNWPRLSDADRLRALQAVATLHAQAFNLTHYTVSNAKLPEWLAGRFYPGTKSILIDLAKLRTINASWRFVISTVLHEGYHRNAYELAKMYVDGKLHQSDPRFRRAQLYALQVRLYIDYVKPPNPLNKIYSAQPSEVDANAFADAVLSGRGATSGPTPLHRR